MKTSARAASSSVPLMLWNTVIASAEKPAAPVIFHLQPAAGVGDEVAASLTGSRIVLLSPLVAMVPSTIAPRPSGAEVERRRRRRTWGSF